MGMFPHLHLLEIMAHSENPPPGFTDLLQNRQTIDEMTSCFKGDFIKLNVEFLIRRDDMDNDEGVIEELSLIQCMQLYPGLSRNQSINLTHSLTGCEFSTGPRTNASGILVGPVKMLVYF